MSPLSRQGSFLIKDPVAARRELPETDAATGERSLPYMPISYIQYDRDVDAFGTRLKHLGLESARVAILAETRYEWYVTYLATVNGVGVVVPLDKELPQAEIESLLNRSYADVLVYSAGKKKDVDAIRANLPMLSITFLDGRDDDIFGPGCKPVGEAPCSR